MKSLVTIILSTLIATQAWAKASDQFKVVGVIGIPDGKEGGVVVLQDTRTGKSVVARGGKPIPGHNETIVASITAKDVTVKSRYSIVEESLDWVAAPASSKSYASTSSYSSSASFADEDEEYDENLDEDEIEEFMERVPPEPRAGEQGFRQIRPKNAPADMQELNTGNGSIPPVPPLPDARGDGGVKYGVDNAAPTNQGNSGEIQYWEKQLNAAPPPKTAPAIPGGYKRPQRDIRQQPNRSFQDLNRKEIERIRSKQ